MSTLSGGSRLTRTLRNPRCHQPWLSQRRLFSPSATALYDPVVAANLNRSVQETDNVEGKTARGFLSSSIASLRRERRGEEQPSGTNGGWKKKPRSVLGQTAEKPIRTRFAPSPTGYLHLGSLRTALFNNLASVASEGGSFVLRLEDTDQKRFVEDAEERIIQDLKWLGLEWSEGPDCGGPHGPYRQSERLGVYKAHVQKLIDSGYAYRCFCKEADLETQKLARHEAGLSTFYPGTCRSVSADEAERRAAAGESHTVRFRGDAFGILGLKDAIYGKFQKKEPEEDFIILKTDGYPTYHLANVVDDHLMNITHVIRGEEWLVSTPKHLALYKAFGWKPPTFAHLGLLVNTDGSKLSKRNESANVLAYKNEGYSAMPMQAWLANLGSSFKSGYKGVPRTMEDVAEALTFKFTKGGIKLNPEKLDGYEVKYHQSIILSPVRDLVQREEQLIEDTMLRPLWNEVERLTNYSPGEFENNAGVAWEKKKELVPMLQSEETRMVYLRRIFENLVGRYKHRGYMQDLVRSSPYYFWRVPKRLYKRGLLDQSARNNHVLDAVLDVSSVPAMWVDGDKRPLVADLKRSLEDKGGTLVPPTTLFNELRFIATGHDTASSHDAYIMFSILGREEWQLRATDVANKSRALAEGGKDVEQKWLDEASSWDRSWVEAHGLAPKEENPAESEAMDSSAAGGEPVPDQTPAGGTSVS